MSSKHPSLLALLLVALVLAWTSNLRHEATLMAQVTPAEREAQALFDRYRTWTATVPPEQRSPAAMADLYRKHLQSQGVTDADITRHLALIEQEGKRLEAERWNQYFTRATPAFNTGPNAFMVDVVKDRTPGRALDVGMGQGRNALWLARQGWRVTGFDPADRAVALARAHAATLGLALDAQVKADDDFDFGVGQWDLILLSYVGCGRWHDSVERALAPGGIVVAEAFHADAARDHRIGGSICATGELPHLFQGLRTLRYEEPIAMPDFATERMRIVRYLAEKPRN